MKKELNCKPITYTSKTIIKYFVRTNYCESVFDNKADYERFILHLRLMNTSFKVTIKTIYLLYSNNALVNRQVFNEYYDYSFAYEV